MKNCFGKRAREQGQGLVEYLILVCLVAVSAIAVVTVVGTNVRELYANVSGALRNEKSAVKLTKPGKGTYQRRGLDDFNESAQSGQ